MHAPDFEFESAMASQMLERYDLTGRSATSQVVPGTGLSPARMVRSGDGAMAVVPRSLLKRTHTNSDMHCKYGTAPHWARVSKHHNHHRACMVRKCSYLRSCCEHSGSSCPLENRIDADALTTAAVVLGHLQIHCI